MFNIISDYHKVDKKKWHTFVKNHPLGNIFHTPEMVHLYSISEKHEPLVITCIKPDETIVGILVADIQSEYGGILKLLSSRAIVWGGPLIKDSNLDVFNLILKEFNKICKHKVVYSQFRNLWETSNYKNLFLSQKYHFEDHLDIHFDLSIDTGIIWENIHPTRRKQINRGLKRGITSQVKESLEPSELLTCYQILFSVYKKAKLPYPPLTFFQSAFDIFSGNKGIITTLAYFNNQIVGFRFVLCYNNQIYDWYAGSLEKYYDKYPNDILPWKILQWGRKNGFKLFDFGGAGKPNKPYGVRDYKVKFGGDVVNFGRYERIQTPFFMLIARFGFLIWKKINK